MKDVILKYFGISSSDIKNAKEYFKIADELELKITKEDKKIISLYSYNISTYDISTYLKIDEIKICQTINKIKSENNISTDKDLIKKFKKLHSYTKYAENEYKKFKQTKIKKFSYNNKLLDKYLLGIGNVEKKEIENNENEDIIFIPEENKLKYYSLD